MTKKLMIRGILLSLLAAFLASVASADIYVTATQNSGTNVEKIASAPWKENVTGPSSPATNMWISGFGDTAEVHIVIDTFTAKGTYLVGEVWDVAWVDWRDVYVTIN